MNTRRMIGTDSNDTTPALILLDYGRRTIVPRPQTYQALVQSIRRYIPAIPDDHDDITFETNEFPMSPGEWIVISEDAWEMVIPFIQVIKVTTSHCTRYGTPIVPGARDNVAWSQTQSVHEDYHIKVVTQTGKTLTIRCSPFNSINHFKALILDKEGIPPDQQRLIYAGRMLEEGDRTLTECGIESGARFDLVIKLRGGKPVIYAYPSTGTRISFKLLLVPEWRFSVIYPVVPTKITTDGQEVEWVVDASPNGVLKEVGTGLEVSYLYWEAKTTSHGLLSPPPSPQLTPHGQVTPEMFVPNRPTLDTANSVLVSVEKISQYLDKSLNALGLHVEARTSFITYWLPSILKYKYIALRFIPQLAYERAAPLTVQPTPDVIGRIFMLFKGVDVAEVGLWRESEEKAKNPVEFWTNVVGVDAEKLKDTNLFRIIEWGGMEVL